MDELIAATVLVLTLMNLTYVALRLRNDIRHRDTILIVLGITAVVVGLACAAFAGFIWWLNIPIFL